jgi:alpha-ketoglutarate-dependent taurine dioxygenase
MHLDVEPATTLGGVAGERHGSEHTTAHVYSVGSAVPDPLGWVRAHRDQLRAGLQTQGVYLLRGFPVDVDAFHEVVRTVGGEPLPYTERSTPRTEVVNGIYTSTEYPSNQSIPMHNENSYSDSWPRTLFFTCHQAPATGGATPIADSRAVLRLVPEEVRTRFGDGVVYARTFRDGLGLRWQEAFQTADRSAVEHYCAAHGIEFEWVGDELRTRQRRPATQRDPRTGQQVWFNQANLFHTASLDPEVRDALRAVYQPEDLPRNAYLGSGDPIPDDDIARITLAYERASIALPWRPGDILIVNNLLMAHGRQPYTGARRVLVAMC